MAWACWRARLRAGSNKPRTIAIIPITTSSSTKVNPRRRMAASFDYDALPFAACKGFVRLALSYLVRSFTAIFNHYAHKPNPGPLIRRVQPLLFLLRAAVGAV